MPWKGEKDPYKIWLSEIILQQTRVDQGYIYYEKFVNAFPTIHHLAQAPEQIIFKLWEGLGYYTRCKNLIITAKYISGSLNGVFPDSYETILALKGIGPYTAAAIASFAFKLPYAVVDGNVFRVLSRYFGINTAIDTIEGKNFFSQLANELLDKKQPHLYNQAIMDFGAVVCKPKQPLCNQCFLNRYCSAFQYNTTDVLPVKENKIVKRDRWFNYFILKTENELLIKKRNEKDIWGNLYEFFLQEGKRLLPATNAACAAVLKKNHSIKSPIITKISKPFRQQLSHQTIYGRFIEVELSKVERTPFLDKGYEIILLKDLSKYAFPRIITMYLNSNEQNELRVENQPIQHKNT
jgi:A/G-specific adenine glycosylase